MASDNYIRSLRVFELMTIEERTDVLRHFARSILPAGEWDVEQQFQIAIQKVIRAAHRTGTHG